MSRQIQIRRGSAVEHEEFTGVIGEITMDTTNKTLRVHDGETVGGTILAKKTDIPSDINTADYVIETWRAADGSSWYRKYKSGWVEQGGTISFGNLADGVAKNLTAVFSLNMLNTNYSVQVTPFSNSSYTRLMGNSGPRSISGVELGVRNIGGNTNQIFVNWSVYGYSA